jgi:ATP-dependent DNA helicase RecG
MTLIMSNCVAFEYCAIKIAEMFFYAGLIEQWGSGTLAIVRECLSAGLPEPQFEEKQGGLWLTFPRSVLTESYLRSLGLNERQIAAVRYVREKGKINNREYQELNRVSKPSATRELTELVTKKVFGMAGKGRSIYYIEFQEFVEPNEPNMSRK